MNAKLYIDCTSYEIEQLIERNSLSFIADFQDVYLIDDFKVSGKYLRSLISQLDQKTYEVNYPKGSLLKTFIRDNIAIDDEIIEIMVIQIIEGLVTLYQHQLLGRCFNINNIFWNGNEITMMNFGFYPSVWEQHPKYNHKLDVLLLGKIAYSLILCNEKVKEIDFEELKNAPIKFRLKELTQKMLEEENQRIDMSKVAEYFQNRLSQEAIQFFLNDYKKFCKLIDEKIKLREQQTYHLVRFENVEDDEDQKNQEVEKMEDMPYLLYQNKLSTEDKTIWWDIHEQLYRIFLLERLKIIIEENYEPKSKKNLASLKFIVEKTIIIQKQYLDQYLIKQIKEKHPHFFQSSDSLRTLRKILKDQIYNQTVYLMSNEEEFDVDELILNARQDQKQHFTFDIFEKEFDDIKKTFRWHILDVYKQLEKQVENAQTIGEQYQYLQLQFQVLLALILNQVIVNKDKHFKTIKSVVKCKQIRPNDIEIKFMMNATITNFRDQIAEINEMYFSKK